mgnify:CR=1 FL=1
MALSRYSFAKRSEKGKKIHSSKASHTIYNAVRSGAIQSSLHVLEEGERLDQLAGLAYGDGSLWWIISAASGIGWALQVPPGTRLSIPTNAGEVFSLLS